MNEGRLNNFLVRAIPPLIALLMRFWFGTCRVKVHNRENFFSPEEGEERTIVASFWHYSIIYIFYILRKYNATAMVSASRDGEYIARLAKHLNFSTVRGSKNNRGVEALKSMLRVISTGESCAIVADGSQGPPRIAQPGALLLASKSGVPIIPMAWSASSYYSIRSWDRTAIPKPFSTIHFYFGEPFHLPPRLKSKELEQYRMKLEDKLNALYCEAWAHYGKQEH